MERIDEELVVRTSGAGEVVITRRQRPAWRQEVDKAIARARHVLKVNQSVPLRWAAVVPEDLTESPLAVKWCFDALPNGFRRQIPGGAIAVDTDNAPTTVTSISSCGSVIVCQYAIECLDQRPLSRDATIRLFCETVLQANRLFCANNTTSPPELQKEKHFSFGIEDVLGQRMMWPGKAGTPFPDEAFFYDIVGTLEKCNLRRTAESGYGGLLADAFKKELCWAFNIE